MASLFSPATITFQQNPKVICFSPLKPTFQSNFDSLSNRLRNNPGRCNAFFGNIPDDQSLSQFPVFQSSLVQFQRFTGELSDMQRWVFLVFGGLTWIYLTARPGVLIGAIDAYLLAPLQLGLDSLIGRRNLKRTDFVIGDKLGEGSFGVVYSGAIVPKNVDVEERGLKRGRGKSLELDSRFKERVILKKVLEKFYDSSNYNVFVAFSCTTHVYYRLIRNFQLRTSVLYKQISD